MKSSDIEQHLRQSIEEDRLQAHLEVFSQLFRDSGTKDEEKAAEYISSELTRYGLSPTTLRFKSYLSWPGDGSLEIDVDGIREEIATRTRSFGGATPPGGVTAELVFVPFEDLPKGSMIFSHRAVPGDYSSVDVAGKIVVSRDGGPDGIRRAQENGAVAHIHVWPSDEDAVHEMIATPVWGTPTTQTADRIPQIPAFGITLNNGLKLERKLAHGAVWATVHSDVKTAWAELPLVIADVPGRESDNFLLVGSHIDSWYEGITDNATGDASLLELARVLAEFEEKLTHGVRFAWWPGHSTGRYSGSTWYADTYFMELRNKALGYLNIDSPGSRGATIWDCRYNCGEIEDVTTAVVKDISGQTANIRRPLKAGDQSFLGVGLPSLGAFRMLPEDHPDRKAVGGCGGGWWWHTPYDTIDKADKKILAEDTEVYAGIISRMCAPQLTPYDFRPVANDFISRLKDYGSDAGVHLDLTVPAELAQEFLSRAELFHNAALEKGTETPDAYNAIHMRLSRILNPVLFTVEGPYEFDPALQMPVLPGLRRAGELQALEKDWDTYGFLRTELVRQANRVTDTLQIATQVIDDFLQNNPQV